MMAELANQENTLTDIVKIVDIQSLRCGSLQQEVRDYLQDVKDNYTNTRMIEVCKSVDAKTVLNSTERRRL